MQNPPKVRDMDVDGWQSCQKWQDAQDSMVLNVEHYFSSECILLCAPGKTHTPPPLGKALKNV